MICYIPISQKSIGEIVVVVVGICLKMKIPVPVFAHAHTHAHIHYIDVIVHERFPSGAAAHAAPVAVLGYFIKGFSFIIIIFFFTRNSPRRNRCVYGGE